MRKLAYLLALLVLLVSPLSAAALSPSSTTVYDGIDVSHWQGNIDFEQVAASGISIVYIKSSEGADMIDEYFETNYINAKANGLSVGFYHYLTADTTEQAAAEAQFFASLVSGKDYDCLLAMDYESFNESLDTSTINAIAATFLQTLTTASGTDSAVIYSDVGNASNIFSAELAAAYPLWIADYTGELPDTAGGWSSYAGYQYTNSGTVSGIAGYVDRDSFTENILLSSADSGSSSGNSGSDADNSSGDSSDADSGSSDAGSDSSDGANDPLEYTFTIPLLMSLTAAFTVTAGGGGIAVGVYLTRRASSLLSAAEEANEEAGDDIILGRTEELEEIREIEEIELLELTRLQEERRLRLQEQRRIREEQELEELKVLQKRAQELQEELWALKERAKQDPSQEA